MNLDVALCLPRDAETVALIRTIVTDALRAFGVTDACIDDIRLALSEACTNVIDHAEADEEYEVHLKVDGSRCVISVKNNDTDFDAAALDGVMPDEESARGRGVAIMQSVMDHVSIDSEPEAGTMVRLVKMLEARPDTPLERLQRRA